MNCTYCDGTGQIMAYKKDDRFKTPYIFKCFCPEGSQYNSDHFVKWGSRFENTYEPEYKRKNAEH